MSKYYWMDQCSDYILWFLTTLSCVLHLSHVTVYHLLAYWHRIAFLCNLETSYSPKTTIIVQVWSRTSTEESHYVAGPLQFPFTILTLKNSETSDLTIAPFLQQLHQKMEYTNKNRLNNDTA